MHIDIARCEARPRPRLGRDARCEARPRPSRRLPSWLSEVGRHSGGTRAVLLRAFPTLFRRDVLVVEGWSVYHSTLYNKGGVCILLYNNGGVCIGMSSSKLAPWHLSSPCSLSSETATRNYARKPGIGRQIGITPARSSFACGSMSLISASRLANRARRFGFSASGIRSPPERPTCRQRSGNQTIRRPRCGAAIGSLLWSHVRERTCKAKAKVSLLLFCLCADSFVIVDESRQAHFWGAGHRRPPIKHSLMDPRGGCIKQSLMDIGGPSGIH